MPASHLVRSWRSHLQDLGAATRRLAWLNGSFTWGRLFNLFACGASYALRKGAWGLPCVIKVDLSPQCNLHCTACIHALPNGRHRLARQHFTSQQRMGVPQFRRLVQQVEHHALAMSLYYLGDPLTYPDLEEVCAIAAQARISTHISTNFSLKLGDDRLHALMASGLGHLTVCVDGLTQETYARTRVGGHIKLVLENLERLCSLRNRRSLKRPYVEVQYISFDHNRHEVEPARRLCKQLSVDRFSVIGGGSTNWTELDPDNLDVVEPRRPSALPLCCWPYFFTVVKYNGDVIPCCEHRLGAQYSDGGDARVFGNVFDTPLQDIWRARVYHQARRLAANPERYAGEARGECHFCDACSYLFVTRRRCE